MKQLQKFKENGLLSKSMTSPKIVIDADQQKIMIMITVMVMTMMAMTMKMPAMMEMTTVGRKKFVRLPKKISGKFSC